MPTLTVVASLPMHRAGLLDLAAGIGISGSALMLLYSFDLRPIWMTATVTALIALAVLVWVLWRRSGQRSHALAVTFAAVATATIALGDGALYYGVVWTACLVLGVTFRSAGVLWLYTGVMVAVVFALHVSAGSPLEAMIAEAIAAAFFAGLGAAVAALLRDSMRVGEELQQALIRLDAVNGELRRRLDADRDLVLARERERTARELHDGLGHRLTAIGLAIDYATAVADPAAARAELDRARGLVGESLGAMRRLVRAMHPVELGELGNAAAFRAVAAAFRGSGIDIGVSVEGDDGSLSHEQSLLLLRFVQEGLTNVVRHSEATTAHLSIAVSPEQVDAVIEDGGATGSVAVVVEGFGLRSLRDRAQAIGGHLAAGPTATGFRVSMMLPQPAEVAA